MANRLISDEQELKVIFQEISSIISRNIYNVTGERKKQLLKKMENYIQEAEEILEKMKFEIKRTNENKNQNNAKIKNAQTSINKYKTILAQEKRNIRVNERTQLLGEDSNSHIIDYSISDMDQRTKLLNNTQRVYNMNTRFDETRIMSLEAEQTGIDTLQMLHQQRQQLMRTNEALNNTNSEIGVSGRMLNQMQKNNRTMKLLTILLVMIIVSIVIIAVYIKISSILK